MKLLKCIEPLSAMRTRSSELVDRARDTGSPVVLTRNGKAAAVLQDVESYERQQEALLLLKALAQGDQDLREGRTVSTREAKRRLNATLEQLRSLPDD